MLQGNGIEDCVVEGGRDEGGVGEELVQGTWERIASRSSGVARTRSRAWWVGVCGGQLEVGGEDADEGGCVGVRLRSSIFGCFELDSVAQQKRWLLGKDISVPILYRQHFAAYWGARKYFAPVRDLEGDDGDHCLRGVSRIRCRMPRQNRGLSAAARVA